MKPDKLSVHELFQKERRYVVPLYQRAYVWNQEDQWEPLWEDIERQADACLAAEHKVALRSHFLGAVVLNVSQIVGGGVARSEVIDGQQRLTTLQLVLAAMRDQAVLFGSANASKIGKLTVHDDEKPGSEDSFKVWPTNADRDVFRVVMRAGSPQAVMGALGATKPSGLARIAAAYVFFSQKVAAYVTAAGDEIESREERFFGLLQALRTALQIIVIELESSDDPQVIFETLNARGQPLLPSDLIRNYVFMQAARDRSLSADQLYELYWRPFDDKRLPFAINGEDRFWHVIERQGRLTRPRIDLFIFHYLTMKTEAERNIGTLFREFSDWRDREPTPTEALLADLKTYSHYFETMIAPSGNDRVAIFARRLKSLDTSTVYPLMMHVLSLPADRLSMSSRDRMIDDLESWLVRRFVCGSTNKNYNGVFLSLLRKLKRSGEGADLEALFRSELAGSTDLTRNWPDDVEFRRAWVTKPIYVRSRPDRSCMLLRAVEDQIRTRRNEAVTLPDGLTVEHLLPQKGSLSDYPYASVMPLEADEAVERCRARMLDTVGNLTLLTGELNASASNGPFPQKVRKIVDDSDLRLNAWLRDTPPSAWDETSIMDRAGKLFEIARRIWISPPARATAAVEATSASADPELPSGPFAPQRSPSGSASEGIIGVAPLTRPSPNAASPRASHADDLSKKFDAAMRDIYARASRETSYRPSYFLQMVDERGGLSAAHALLAGRPSEGFTRLWEMRRLDLSVEALVLEARWRDLFEPSELATAERRLSEVGFR